VRFCWPAGLCSPELLTTFQPKVGVSGKRGSATTVLSTPLLKGLINRNAAPMRTPSREEGELMIVANCTRSENCRY
jgi:hypothetical protein